MVFNFKEYLGLNGKLGQTETIADLNYTYKHAVPAYLELSRQPRQNYSSFRKIAKKEEELKCSSNITRKYAESRKMLFAIPLWPI